MQSIVHRLKKGVFPGYTAHYLEAKNAPDKTAQELIEARCGRLSLAEMDALSIERGYAAGIYMPTPDNIVLVWNNKTRTGVEHFAEAWDRGGAGLPKDVRAAWREFSEYKAEHGADAAHRMRHRAFSLVRDWVLWKRKELVSDTKMRYDATTAEQIIEYLDLRPFKPDKFGFFGGRIYDWEKFLYGPAYPLEAFARETREEGGIHPLWSMLVETNCGKPNAQYEQWFFWIIESTFVLQTEGVKGETDAPVEMPIAKLNQKNFYWSHAKILLKHLQWLVEVAGERAYAESYATLKQNFGQSLRPRIVPKEPDKPVVSIDESWEDVMGSVTPLR